MGATVGSAPVSAVDLLIAAGVALLAGVINSIAGGGSLILFPVLVALGLGTVAANVTNSIAQWPGYIGGVLGFRKEYGGQRSRLIRFSVVGVLGGATGSVLLLTTPSEAFNTVVPILVLLASLLLAVQPLLTKRLKRAEDGARRQDPVWLYVALFLATVYGGYFGGALGVILVGVLGVGLHRLKLANAMKSAISMVTATVTLVVFGIFGPVAWEYVAVCAPASLVGGFLGAKLATRIPTTPLRVMIVVFGVAVSIYLWFSV
ncbi:sulfite exporter TauE/SafE family protein [Modestobacter lapidis]